MPGEGNEGTNKYWKTGGEKTLMGQVQKSDDRSSIQTCVPYVGLDSFGVHFNNLGVKKFVPTVGCVSKWKILCV